MSDGSRWIQDARIPGRMHAQGLPLDMMLSVDRGSDAVVLRVTTRHLSRDEARELGARLIEADLIAGGGEIPRGTDAQIIKIVDGDGDTHMNSLGGFRAIMPSQRLGRVIRTMEEIRERFGIREIHYAGRIVQLGARSE